MTDKSASTIVKTSKFVYVIYIRTTPEKLWEALIKPEFTRQYWGGTEQKSDWKPGSSWQLVFPDGGVGDSGEVIEIDKPKRLVLKWRNEFRPELKTEGYSRATIEIEPTDEKIKDAVKLTVTHEIDCPESKFIQAVANGWPRVLASLKSLMETGEALELTVSRTK
jgi:uncharacterized protein YndB with AHSA1/START domain